MKYLDKSWKQMLFALENLQIQYPIIKKSELQLNMVLVRPVTFYACETANVKRRRKKIGS